MAFRYYRTILNVRERNAYDKLIEGFLKMEKEIRVPTISRNEFARLRYALRYDYPEIFYVDFTGLEYVDCLTNVKIKVNYTMSVAEIKSIRKDIYRRAREIIEQTDGMTEIEIEKFLNDELRKMAVYGKNPVNTKNAHNIVGPLINGKCVCEAYSITFKFLTDLLDMKSIVVVGTGRRGLTGNPSNHAWNIVMIDGEFYHLDITYNGVSIDSKNGEIIHFSRDYFNLSDTEMFRDHALDNRFEMPSCQKNRSPVPIISSVDELIECLREESTKKERFTEVRFTEYYETSKEVRDMISKAIKPNDRKWYSRMRIFVKCPFSMIFEWI